MNPEKIISFHGKQEIKDQYLARLEAHKVADEIIQGTYWENGKGCAVGCTIHSDKHDAYQTELGISWRLALLEDGIFEKLPNAEAKEFPIQFLSAIPVGVDTDIAFRKFVRWSLEDEVDGLIHIVKDKEAVEIYKEIAGLYQEMDEGKTVSRERWLSLAQRARSAYAYAYASAYAYAYAYASASAYAYASASASAYASAFKTSVGEAAIKMRDKLLFFLKELK